MDWVKVLFTALKFFVLEFPKFYESYKNAQKDNKYKKEIDRFGAAVNAYKNANTKEDRLDRLKELE